MSAGITVQRGPFDQSIGQHARNVIDEITFWNDLSAWVNGVGGGFSGIQAAPLSYSDSPPGSGDATRVFASCADMAQLFNIFHGTATLGVAKDFTANLKFLTGTP
jgi:hypothetical protein